ncbi:CDI toxin immunity protein [Haloplasma contractile]
MKLEELNLLNEDVYILWDDGSLLAIKSKLKHIISTIDDITAVSFDTWLFHPSMRISIEFYHENEITLVLKITRLIVAN